MDDNTLSHFSDIVLDNTNQESLTLKDNIKIFEAYVRERGFIYSQIEAYNYFVTTGIHEIISNANPIIYGPETNQVNIYFENLIFRKPHYANTSQEFRNTNILYPYEARDRNINYSSQMTIDMTIAYSSNFNHKFKNIAMGEMPVMIRSCLCNTYEMTEDELYAIKEDPLDEGGYFVIAGKKGNIGERVLVNQERSAYNKIYLFTNRKKVPKFTHYAEIRSSIKTTCSMTQVGIIDKKINVIIQWIPEKNCIPLGIVFLALGIEHKDIIQYISEDQTNLEYIIPSLEQSYEFYITQKADNIQEVALEYIGRMGKMFVDKNSEDSLINAPEYTENAIGYAKYLLQSQFLPHLGTNFSKKAYFLGYMVNRLINFITSKRKKIEVAQDRDHYANKRIQNSGELLGILFNQAFSKAINDMKKNCEARSLSSGRSVIAKNFFKARIFTETLNGNLNSNKWGCVRGGKTGISKVYERFNNQMMISQRCRLVTPIAAEGKVTLPRRLHPSSFGFICISETPEGRQVGLTKNMSIGAYITIGSKGDPVIGIILGLDNIIKEETGGIGIVKLEEATQCALSYTKIFINGSWEAITDQGKLVMSKLRELKCNCQFNPEISIVYENNEIRICTDMGRLVRPLYIVDLETGSLKVTKEIIQKVMKGEMVWQDLISQGYIEIIDAEEQDSSSILIATFPEDIQKNPNFKYTHCEIHPIFLYGAAGALTPYSHTNQSPRNCYQCSMAKQAIGIPGLNYRERNNETQYILDYPQKPIITTSVSEVLGYNTMPCGQNVIVAIMPFYGYNQEDSIVINKSSAERGLFNTTSYVNYTVQLRPFEREKEILGIPTKELCHDITGNVTDSLCTEKIIMDGSAEHPDEIRVDMKSYREITARYQQVPYAVAKIGSIVKKGDIVIGVLKFIPEEDRIVNQRPYRNHSIVYDHFNYGQVIKVIYGYDGNGYFFVNVKLAAVRPLEIGDKYSSRHAQKGTCGLMVRQEDLPFSPDPFSAPYPDLIINPLCLPSRMTIAQLIECIMAKKVTVTHKERWEKNNFDPQYENYEEASDGTPFLQMNIKERMAGLKRLGYESTGTQMLINGITGEPIEDAFIFMGPTYYQRLKHLVSNKVHARSTGPNESLTRQPTAGRSREGGLKCGLYVMFLIYMY